MLVSHFGPPRLDAKVRKPSSLRVILFRRRLAAAHQIRVRLLA
jgi:hypothetical protein